MSIIIWKIVFYFPQSINPINLEENWPISIHSSILFHIEVMSWQWHDWCHFTQLRLGALIDSLQKTLDRSIHLVTFWWLCQPIFFILLSFDTACRYYNMRTKTFMVASCELLCFVFHVGLFTTWSNTLTKNVVCLTIKCILSWFLRKRHWRNCNLFKKPILRNTCKFYAHRCYILTLLLQRNTHYMPWSL